MIIELDHINLVVKDLTRSINFYTGLLGFSLVEKALLSGKWVETIVGLKNVRADVAYLLPPAGKPRFELLCYLQPKGDKLLQNSLANCIGIRHIAFKVTNINEKVAYLRKAGVTFINDPVQVPKKVVRHKDGQKKLCYFYDPDGILLELAEYTPLK